MKVKASVQKLKEKAKTKKRQIAACAAAILTICAFTFPIITRHMAFKNLGIENAVKITYVQYVGEAFASSVKVQRTLEDEGAVKEFTETVSQGKIPYAQKGKAENSVVFFHMENGDRISAFVDGANLGFNYGKLWIKTGDLSDRFDIMEEQDLVKIKDLPSE
jgi:hypothetical protein